MVWYYIVSFFVFFSSFFLAFCTYDEEGPGSIPDVYGDDGECLYDHFLYPAVAAIAQQDLLRFKGFIS